MDRVFEGEQPMIEFNHVGKTFGDQRAVGPQFALWRGSFFISENCGTSGSGKIVTTLKMIMQPAGRA